MTKQIQPTEIIVAPSWKIALDVLRLVGGKYDVPLYLLADQSRDTEFNYRVYSEKHLRGLQLLRIQMYAQGIIDALQDIK